MSRRRQDPFKQELIRLLKQGKREDAIELVRAALRKNPEHAAALHEWQRYQRGEGFSYEAAAQRKEQSYCRQLEKILNDFAHNPAQLAGMKYAALKKRSAQLHNLLRKAGGIESLDSNPAELYNLYVGSLTKEIRRRKKGQRGRLTIMIGLLAIVGLMAIGSVALVVRAKQASYLLDEVWLHKEYQPDYAAQVLDTYDTGLNRLLVRRVGHTADRIAHRLKIQNEQLEQAYALLNGIRNGSGKLADLDIAQRIHIQKLCNIRSQKSAPLIALWQELYGREKEQMERQKSRHIAELLTPLPTMPALSGIPQKDAAVFKMRLGMLHEKLTKFKGLRALYQLKEELISPIEQEAAHLRKAEKESKSLQKVLHTLPAAHSYSGYHKILQQRPKISAYTAANRILAGIPTLPAQKDVQLSIQQHANPDIPRHLLPAAIRTLVYEKSSISLDCSATREQIQTMENVFALSGAPIVLYQLINQKNDACYSETAPEIKDNQVIFRRSVYDPERQTGDIRPVTWENPRAVWIKTIDARPVWNACGFDRPQQFFNEAHFPTILSNVLNTEAPHCPALARAYFYHKISELIRQHRAQTLVGIGFAPTMEQHMADFEQLRRKCDISLDGMCWLKVTPEHMAAEQAFARWFRKHQGFFYEKEISQAAEKQLLMHAQYCGYINEWGQPVFHGEQPQPGTRIWYADHGQVCSFSIGSEKAALPRLSPLFIPKKVYKKQYQP